MQAIFGALQDPHVDQLILEGVVVADFGEEIQDDLDVFGHLFLLLFRD